MMHASAILGLGSVAGAIAITILVSGAVLGTGAITVADTIAIGIVAGLPFDALLLGQSITGACAIADSIG